MTNDDAAAALEAILVAENDALGRNDPAAAVALLPQKLAAAEAVGAQQIAPEHLARLRGLAAQNRRMLETAIRVQGQIVAILVRAAQTAANESRYSAAGRTVRHDRAVAVARQA